MKRLYAYFEKHVTEGYVVECYVEGKWACIFRHLGSLETLYTECERRAKHYIDTRFEALIEGLPKLATA